MSCEYCATPRAEIACCGDCDDGVTVEMSCENGPWELEAEGHYDGGYCCGVAYAEIRYCPMCGRKLTEEGL